MKLINADSLKKRFDKFGHGQELIVKTIDQEPEVTACWERDKRCPSLRRYVCSACGYMEYWLTTEYCPNCGARNGLNKRVGDDEE